MKVYLVDEYNNGYYKLYGIFSTSEKAIARFKEIVDSRPFNPLIQYTDSDSGESLPYVDLRDEVLSVTEEEVE